MTKYCPMCGYANPDQANYCTRCGSPFPAVQAQQPSPTAPTTPQPGTANTQAYTLEDVRGLEKVRLYALLGVFGIIISVAAIFFTGLGAALLFSTRPGGHRPLGLLLLAELSATAVGVAISAAAFILLYQGLKTISLVDSSLTTPARLLLLVPAGLLVLVVGLALVAAAPLTGGFSALSGLALLALSLIMLVVGGVGGEVLGLWRVGSRYRESLIQLGGLLIVVPVLNVVSPILVYVGCGEALAKVRGRLQAQPTPKV